MRYSGWGLVGLLPDPPHPALVVLPEELAGLLAEEAKEAILDFRVSRPAELDQHGRIGVSPGSAYRLQGGLGIGVLDGSGLKEQFQRRDVLGVVVGWLGPARQYGESRQAERQPQQADLQRPGFPVGIPSTLGDFRFPGFAHDPAGGRCLAGERGSPRPRTFFGPGFVPLSSHWN